MINFTSLTKGCLPALMDDKYEGEYPVLQVLGTKKVSGVGGSERYRLLLSDGQYLQSFAMLATHLNGMVENGDLSEHAIIRVKQHLATAVNTSAKNVLIIVAIDLLHKAEVVGAKIGQPATFESTNVATMNADRVDQVAVRSVDLRARIAELEALTEQQRAMIDEKDAKITFQGAKIKELVEKIAEHGDKIEKLEASISEVLNAQST